MCICDSCDGRTMGLGWHIVFVMNGYAQVGKVKSIVARNGVA